MLPRPTDLLAPADVQRLRRRSDSVGVLLVLHAWGMIGGAVAVFAAWPNPLTLVLAIMVIGTRQLGLAILMHDAAHGLLCADRRLNDGLGKWLCAAPVFTSLTAYRPYHLQHHRHAQQAQDPDLSLSAPFPISRASLRRKMVRDLTGRTALQRRGEQLRRALGSSGRPVASRLADLWRSEGPALSVNAGLLLGLAAIGQGWLYPLLWLLPLATWYQLVSRLRNIAEHAVVPDNDDPLRNTRTTRANWLERLFLAPYWVNFHLEHHLFMFVPCWRLPAAHRLMLARGHGPRMEIQPGYRTVLAQATAAAVDVRRAAGTGRGTQHI